MNMGLMFMYVLCVDVNVITKGYKCNQRLFKNILLFHNIINSAIGKVIWHLCRCLGVPVPNYLYFVYSKDKIALVFFKLSNEILGVRPIPVSCRRMEVSILRPTPIYLMHCNITGLISTENCASVIPNTTNINQVTYISFHIHFTVPINNIVKHKNSSLKYE